MQWTLFKNTRQLPADKNFLIWQYEHGEWLEVSLKNQRIICRYFEEDVEISAESISHFCVPDAPRTQYL